MMDTTEALKERIARSVEKATFFAEAESLSDPSLAMGTWNPKIQGKCLVWPDEAEKLLKADGLEVLPMCQCYNAAVNRTAHEFLLVRDPNTGARVYYDPSAEQYGVIGAHKKAFTWNEVCAFNQKYNGSWLENPIVHENNYIGFFFWRDRPEEWEAMKQKWGDEIKPCVTHTDSISFHGTRVRTV